MTERRGNVVQRKDGAENDGSEPESDRARGSVSGETRTRTRPGTGARRPLTIAVACLALALGVTGCTGAPSPASSSPGGTGTVLPSPTTRPPSPSLSPATVAAPERPAAMDRDDAEGAIAAATYFISLYAYVYATGELGEWMAISDPACVFCKSVHDDKLAAFARGERSEGGSISVVGDPTSIGGGQEATFQVDAAIIQEPYRVYDEAGLVIGDHPQQSGQMAIAVSSVPPGQWRVVAVSTEESTP